MSESFQLISSNLERDCESPVCGGICTVDVSAHDINGCLLSMEGREHDISRKEEFLSPLFILVTKDHTMESSTGY